MSKAKILIVDDRPENLLTLEGLLDEPDIQTIRATSGEEALALTLDHEFALVLLDVQMPGMSGYEVAELMRGNKKTKNIPIIFVTAEVSGDQHLFKGYESGAVDFLFKPLNPVIFQSKVGVFIELHRQQRELRQKSFDLDMKIVELEELQQQLEEMNEQLLLLSITDGLTGLLNRRQFDILLEDEWRRAYRNKTTLSVLIMDIDHFKIYNDTFGHAAGDECLIRIAHALAESVKRNVDKVARIGGEEFGIILPDTDEDGAKCVAETIRKNIEEMGIPHAPTVDRKLVTASLGGAATTPEEQTTGKDMYKAADAALYRAKAQGRNQTCTISISDPVHLQI